MIVELTSREATALLHLGIAPEPDATKQSFSGVDFASAIEKLRLAAKSGAAPLREEATRDTELLEWIEEHQPLIRTAMRGGDFGWLVELPDPTDLSRDASVFRPAPLTLRAVLSEAKALHDAALLRAARSEAGPNDR